MEGNRQLKERNFWDAFAKRYDPFMKSSRRLYEGILKSIEQEVEPGFIIIDLATGTGLLALELAQKVKKVVGIDISPCMIEIAKDKSLQRNIGNTEFFVGDAYQLPFPQNTFDAVLICNALHVMIQPECVFAEAYRVLKEDGLLIAPTFCHGESKTSRLLSFVMGLFGFKAFHKWSVASFEKFVNSNYFEVIRKEKTKGLIPLSFLVAKKGQA